MRFPNLTVKLTINELRIPLRQYSHVEEETLGTTRNFRDLENPITSVK
jgi:hypothetical protein